MCFRNGATLKVARRDVPLRNGIIFLSALISAAGALLLSGCSGGHSSGSTGSLPTPTPTPTPIVPAPVGVSAQIVWPARSRAVSTIGGTSAGLSATITLTGTGTNGTVSVVANRPAGPDTAAVTSTYALSGTAVPGNLYSLKVNFFSQTSAQGTVVGTASQANTLVQSDGTLKATVITTATNVSTVTVRDVATVGSTTGLGGIVQVGQTADVLYSLYDSGGNLLAAPPAAYGSGFVTVADTTKLTTPSGAGDEIVGVAPTVTSPTAGTTFTVSVDGVTSNPFTITVLSTEKVAVSPNPGTVSPGIPQVFVASASTLAPGDAAFGVTWTFESSTGVALTTGGANGTFTSTGTTFTYTPPVTVPPVVGPYKLVATSVYDPNVSVTVPVTVASLVSVSISPNPATTISLKQTEAFTANVFDDPTGAGVSWTATAGTFSSTTTTPGVSTTYTAPSTTGTYTLTATSLFDTTKSGTVTITVNSLVAVAISPHTPNPIPLSIDQTKQFTALVVTDPTNAGVTWSIQDSAGNALTNGGTGGTISTTGLYTAPASVATASGTIFIVVASSALDPTKQDKVPVSVGSANVPVTVN